MLVAKHCNKKYRVNDSQVKIYQRQEQIRSEEDSKGKIRNEFHGCHDDEVKI